MRLNANLAVYERSRTEKSLALLCRGSLKNELQVQILQLQVFKKPFVVFALKNARHEYWKWGKTQGL